MFLVFCSWMLQVWLFPLGRMGTSAQFCSLLRDLNSVWRGARTVVRLPGQERSGRQWRR